MGVTLTERTTVVPISGAVVQGFSKRERQVIRKES
jgi:hypothetical protein